MNKRSSQYLAIAGILGALGVGLGAFGAHTLKDHLINNGRLDTYETAVLYHMIHTLALMGTALLLHFRDNVWIRRASIFFTIGIIIFSGSLYMLCFTGVTWLGAITPIGGVFFILGWLSLTFSAISKK
ncbi:MAG: DUF423 domain-containing protein [Fulvivirga sp.]